MDETLKLEGKWAMDLLFPVSALENWVKRSKHGYFSKKLENRVNVKSFVGKHILPSRQWQRKTREETTSCVKGRLS